MLDKIKVERGCKDCGYRKHACAMDFDHRDPKLKILAVSKILVKGWSEKRILDEVAKCDVRCAICHRIKSAKDIIARWPSGKAPGC